MSSFPVGSQVTFKPGPKSTGNVIAKVTGQEGAFLTTVDAAGKARKIRPGACTAA